MEITAHYSTKTGTIKQAFNRMFPYLKIEFIKTLTGNQPFPSDRDLILHNRYLGEINERLTTGTIEISGDCKASNLERLFLENFGLAIRVLKKEKKQWIPAATEGLSLIQQNEEAKAYDSEKTKTPYLKSVAMN
ncbi:MAG: hypothetical protein ABIN36_07275 [Ferruginibacter sp.]